MKTKRGILVAVLAAMYALSGNAFAATTITNGSFETGPGGTYAAVTPPDSSITDWTLTQAGVEWFNPDLAYSIGTAADGSYIIDLAYGSGGGIQQTVDTTVGNVYHLSFEASTSSFAGRDGTGQIDVLIKDDSDAITDSKSFNVVNNSSTVLAWQTFTLDFLATTATTTIEFQNNQDGNLHFAFIDNVYEDGTPVTCNGMDPTIVGTNGHDVIYGTPGNDVIMGLGGNDVIYGYDGEDSICAGDDDDTVKGGNGNDTIDGGSGNDTLIGEAGNDTLYGDDGNDRLLGEAGDDTLDGGAGDDMLYGQDNNDDMSGGDGTDTCAGGRGTNTADETCETTSGVPIPPPPVPLAYCGIEEATIVGTDAGETIIGTPGHDVIVGLGGNDTIKGNGGGDTICGGDGNDRLIGASGVDQLFGEGGNDRLYGYGDGDTLDGGAGNDYLYGGYGDDTLIGGADTDVCYGQAGTDTAVDCETAIQTELP